MADLQAPRGMHDLLPEDAALWRHIRDTAERVSGLYDYRYIQTPLVEDVAVFQRTSGDESDIVSKEMYVFDDRGGDRLALRPEGTAGVCRAYLEHGMGSRPQPVRLFYFGAFFRYDRPQAGRYRQLWQFGVEHIGDESPAADVEVIELQHTLYTELGLDDLVLRINSIGTAETRHRYVEALREHFRPHVAGLSPDSQRRYETNVLRILDSKEDAGHPAVESAPSILDFLSTADAEHFAQVRASLDALGIAYLVDPRIVRGLDYYARTVWEFDPAEAGGQSTVGAGGRYDGLIELLGGPHTPGVGFGTGIERIAMNLRERGLGPAAATPVDVAMIPLGEAGAAAALRVARALRAAGLAVRGGTPGRSMRAQLRSAANAGARFAAIVGDAEAAADIVQLKPLATEGEQIAVAMGGVVEAVRLGRAESGL
ncbi:MAG: histidine--tRNA ligase [Dehalococcoidia bacterium]